MVGDSLDYEPSAERSVASIAAQQGKDPKEVAFDLLCEDDYNGMLYFPLFNYSEGSLDVLHKLHQHPQTAMGPNWCSLRRNLRRWHARMLTH